MAQLIAYGTAAATSAEFTLTEGQEANLLLYGANGQLPPENARARVLQKTSATTWVPVGEMKRDASAKVLAGAGTYKVEMSASAGSGVDKN